VKLNKRNSRYQHLFVVVRLDARPGPDDLATVVSAWVTQESAEAEARRLQGLVRRVGTAYEVQVTRLKEGLLENPDSGGLAAASRGDHDYPIEGLGVGNAGELLTLQRAAYITEAATSNDFTLPLTQTLDELQAELADKVVAPDRQGNGIGTHMLRVVESLFPLVRTIHLFTGEHSTANMRLYTRMGYEETGRTSAGSYDLVHFTMTIAPGIVP